MYLGFEIEPTKMQKKCTAWWAVHYQIRIEKEKLVLGSTDYLRFLTSLNIFNS